MFELETTKATFTKINVRSECHGNEKETGIDLFINIRTGNEILSELHPSLRHFLFVKNENPENESLAGIDDQLTVRRMGNLIETLGGLNCEVKGAEVVIGYGTGGRSDITLGPADVNKFNIEIFEGGSVDLGFKVSISKPGAENIKKLSELLGGEIDITVTPPVDPQGSLLGDGDD